MAAKNERDLSGFCYQIGQNAEDSFFSLAKKLGFKVSAATRKQDMMEHWDFLLEKGAGPIKVEVKSQKRWKVKNDRGILTSDFVLVEFFGITGHNGWIYGRADWIAFERPSGFLLVKRRSLLELAERLCKKGFVTRKEEMLYTRYGRADRQDEVTAVLISDLEGLGAIEWKV